MIAETFIIGLVAAVAIISICTTICCIHGNKMAMARDMSSTILAKARIEADPHRAAELAASEAKAEAFQEAAKLWSAHSDVRTK